MFLSQRYIILYMFGNQYSTIYNLNAFIHVKLLYLVVNLVKQVVGAIQT